MKRTLSAILQENASGDAWRTLVRSPDMEATLRALVQRGQKAWPSLRLSPENFVTYLAQRLPRNASRVPLEELIAEDLWLCCACVEEVPGALGAFDAALLSPALRAIRDNERHEIRQVVLEKLFVGATPKILEFSGTGPLGRWLKVVVRRVALDSFRAAPREELMHEADDPLEPLSRSLATDVEALAVKKTARRHLQKALDVALAELPPRDRELLWNHHIEQVPHGELGKQVGAPRSTIAHWLTRAREKLLHRTRAVLAEEQGLKADEVDSLISALKSRFDISLSGLKPEPRSRDPRTP